DGGVAGEHAAGDGGGRTIKRNGPAASRSTRATVTASAADDLVAGEGAVDDGHDAKATVKPTAPGGSGFTRCRRNNGSTGSQGPAEGLVIVDGRIAHDHRSTEIPDSTGKPGP